MLLPGRIAHEREDGYFVFVPCTNHRYVNERCKEGVTVEFHDCCRISTEQRRKAYALLRYIAEWYGGTPTEVAKELTKFVFVGQQVPTLADTFSLSDTTMEIASKYISFLIDFCITNGIPCGEPLWKLCEDMERYVYACTMNHTCAVCGRGSELHHVDRIGMGGNRREAVHLGMRILPLCRKHHMEVHSMGEKEFLAKYHLEPIKADERVCTEYRLGKE